MKTRKKSYKDRKREGKKERKIVKEKKYSYKVIENVKENGNKKLKKKRTTNRLRKRR